MSKLKRKLFVTVSIIILVFAVFFFSSSGIAYKIGYSNVGTQTIRKSTTFQDENSLSIWRLIEASQPDTLELDIDIFGYSIISTATDPIEYDENGQLLFKSQDFGTISIEICLDYGFFKFDNILSKGHLNFDSEGNYIISYSFDDPMNGFFMDMYMYPNLIWVRLAFDGGINQLCYEGVYDLGYSRIPAIVPNIFEPDHKDEDLSRIGVVDTQILKEQLLMDQRSNIIVHNEKYLNDTITAKNGLMGPSPRITITDYGVVHECYDFSVSYPEDLPDDYWEPYTCIDIGIYRYEPSEATVKSDLQFYNKDYVSTWFTGYIRNIKAYTMGSHGGPEWGVYDGETLVGTIYPNEVSALWYHTFDGYYDTDVYPWDAIVLVDVCYGYYDPGEGTNPTMAKAFVDYGADAFVGATITIPGASDTYMRAFWYDLCQDDETVETSTITLCQTYGGGWNLDDEWCIYGDEDSTL